MGTEDITLPKSIGTQYKAAYHYVVCDVDYVIEPESTQELADAIKAYRKLAETHGKKLKVRVSRRWAGDSRDLGISTGSSPAMPHHKH